MHQDIQKANERQQSISLAQTYHRPRHVARRLSVLPMYSFARRKAQLFGVPGVQESSPRKNGNRFQAAKLAGEYLQHQCCLRLADVRDALIV